MECAVCVHMSMCSVLDDMQVRMAVPTRLRSFIGLRSMCRRAAQLPTDQVVLLECAQCHR